MSGVAVTLKPEATMVQEHCNVCPVCVELPMTYRKLGAYLLFRRGTAFVLYKLIGNISAIENRAKVWAAIDLIAKTKPFSGSLASRSREVHEPKIAL